MIPVIRPSKDAMDPLYYIHVRRAPKGAFALGRVIGAEATFLFSPEYPQSLADQAIEWFGYMVGGVMLTSEFEWWSVTDADAVAPLEVTAALGVRAADVCTAVAEAWRRHDAGGESWLPPLSCRAP